MRVWLYAMKQGLTAVIASEAAVFAVICVNIAMSGGVPSSYAYLGQAAKLMVIIAAVVFPVSVVATRLEVSRNNRVKSR